jgi:hypothetical protein
VVEVGELDPARVGRRQHDQLGAIGVAGDVGREPVGDQHVDGLDRRVEGATRRRIEPADRGLGRQHVDALGAQLDRVGDRSVVGDPAVDQQSSLAPNRRQDAGNRGGGEHGVGHRAVREAQLLAAEQVVGDHVQRDRGLFEMLVLQVPRDQLAQSTIGDQMVGAAGHAAEQCAGVGGKDVLAAQPPPHRRQLLGRGHGRRPRGDEGRVQRPGRGADEHVGDDPALVDRPQHPDLERSKARSAREDEGGPRVVPVVKSLSHLNV